MKITMPQQVNFIIRTIQAAGYEAYAVGGCIRDSLLGRQPNDWDITTSASPAQVKALFPHTIDTGIQHGTVTVMLEHRGYEVTTYRIDGEYQDSRHPKEVQFTKSLTEDLRRRDFTINAMAYNEDAGLVDVFEGVQDLERGLIRCVGEPKERFGEDALRMLRAIRFSAQLGYTIEQDTAEAIRELAPTLSKISAERIQAELTKLLLSPHPDCLRTAYDTCVTSIFFPEFDRAMETPQNHPHHCYTVGEHTLHALLETPADKVLRYAVLLHDIAKPEVISIDDTNVTHFHGHAARGEGMSREFLRRLKMDNDTIDQVSRLVACHDYGNGIQPDARMIRRAVNKIGEDLFPLLLLVKRADILSQSLYQRKEKLSRLAEWERLYKEITDREECVSLKTLAVNGKDLIAAGIAPGRQLGELLQLLLEQVLEDPSRNNREYLLAEALKRC